MKNLIVEKLESLPPLPQSVIELEAFRKKSDKEPRELIDIIEHDPLIITTLLRVANSAMFGFRSEVESPSRAVNLLGINFTISIALSSVVQDLIKSNISSYGISTEEFLTSTNLASTIISSWIGAVDFELKEELLLPAFLQETGKFIISEIISEEKKTNEFQEALATDRSLAEIEKEFTGFTCSKITANIFKHWNLSHNLIFTIGFVDDLENCPDAYIKKVQILQIIKVLCDLRAPLSDDNVKKALIMAKDYGFELEPLSKTIEQLKAKLKIEEE